MEVDYTGKCRDTACSERFEYGLRNQLAALVADTVGGIEGVASYKVHQSHHKQLQKLSAEAPRRQHMRERKLAKARAALHDLIQYEKGLDEYFGRRLLRAAEDSLGRLPAKPPEIPDFHALLQDTFLYSGPQNKVDVWMAELYWFFLQGCGISGHESEVRVALIRNAFWSEYGVSPVHYLPEYRSGESQGCAAVRIAVRRLRLPQGTTR